MNFNDPNIDNNPGDRPRMYHDLASFWPIISPPEEYQEEAAQFTSLIRLYGPVGASTVLHLGCGGGHIDFTLKRNFQVTGVDLSEEMLGLARRLNPEVLYYQGDMRSFQLDQSFDAVIVADSIDYLLDEAALLEAFRTAYRQLKPGGVFCTYAEETIEIFQPENCYCTTHKDDSIQVTLVETQHDPDPGDSQYEMIFVYLIRQGYSLSVEVDRHTAGLFPLKTWPRLLKAAGFRPIQYAFEGDPHPWFIGQR